MVLGSLGVLLKIDFIHKVVVHGRDVAVAAWRSWLQEDLLVHPYKWLRPDRSISPV